MIDLQQRERNLAEVEVGQLTLLFSYETCVGVGIPGVGRIKAKNVWSQAVGRHLNSWGARYEVNLLVLEEVIREVDRTLSGHGTHARLVQRAKRILARAGLDVE